MKAQTAKRMIKIQEWAAQVNAQDASGKSVQEWCDEHGINAKTFYCRRRRVQEELLEAIELGAGWGASETPAPSARGGCGSPSPGEGPTFAALPAALAASPPITVRNGAWAVEIPCGADEAQMELALRMVAKL
jgi:hypothetical protein